MYKATQDGGAGAGDAANASNASSGGEATDVDFEEVKEDKK
jgi:hypothetical protein